MSLDNFYEALKIDPSSPVEEIRQRYKELALKYHPDRNPDENSKNLFSEIAKAYKTLEDHEQRLEHDAKILNRKVTDSAKFNHDEIFLSSLDKTESSFSLDCRCGGSFSFQIGDFVDVMEIEVECDTCSLSLTVKRDED
ncbi:DnaJ -like protein subfamily C member 24 [Halotydeus destructor]|nr:DnaJ -like protein subfamily C member 24 [Halotydeus destructor]